MMDHTYDLRPVGGVVGHCDHCGFSIYTREDMLIVRETGDRIHRDCWPDYAEAHMTDFVTSAGEYGELDCETVWRE